MKQLITAIVLLLSACDRPSIYNTARSFIKSDVKIKLSNTNDTLVLGDTLALTFDVQNPIKTDDGTLLNVTNEVNVSFGYNFNKNNLWPSDVFNFVPMIVEQNKSASSIIGKHYFNGFQMPMLNSTIHFVPQDTGVFKLYLSRDPAFTCTTKEFSDKSTVNFIANFDVQDRHLYLLKNYPNTEYAVKYYKQNFNEDYYIFYVNNK
jgi:hypothetical protein